MKVSALQNYKFNFFTTNNRNRENNTCYLNHEIKRPSLAIVFKSIANAGKLKKLFSYQIPCMYSGTEMIDPKRVQRYMSAKVFEKPIGDIIKIVEPLEKCLTGIEDRVYKIIKETAKEHPEKSAKETVQSISKIHQKRLRKKQAPIFNELNELAQELPDAYRYKFKQFMAETECKLSDKPVVVPFSTTEFKYKLEKIRDDVSKHKNPKAVRVVNKLLSESNRFYKDTNSKTVENQKRILSFMELILSRSILKENEQLNELMQNSRKRLNFEKMRVPFSRKSFIYDLSNIIEHLPDKNLQDKMITTALKLPTSQNSISAYITKIANQPSEKIMYRLLWPFFASVEHILPRSKGGADSMENFGGATTKENSERQNIDFVCQIKRRPQTKKNCQKYLDRMIELVQQGIFDLLNIDKKYIEDFKTAIKKQSKGAIVLDTSKMSSQTLDKIA
ncbi:hypothetical protein IJD34_04650 [bacterium]|nr:hypothetical protein [bacterium]